MRFELLLLDAVDSSLGRVDHESLPQQTLMEMVIEEITNKEKICGDVDEPKDIEEWKGVEIADGEVFGIDWSHYGLRGSVHLEWLPSSVRDLVVTWNQLTANPTKGHLSVVGWTSTPVLGEAKNLFKPLVVFLSWRRPY
ncbi:hypothetical protein XU18_1685 [Perkinsela sp. CCAP 1560/4]|nr:hypothetical protein XU18_1685 [Perkinsela sp. CCAP 1560/4]|eukprot:KNH07684.1 hypothetical protein XU18_1685 [Perkinsela sp. CCAP 1560/4]